MLYDLRDDQWEIIKDILPGKDGDRGRTGLDNHKGRDVGCKNRRAMEGAATRVRQMAYSSQKVYALG